MKKISEVLSSRKNIDFDIEGITLSFKKITLGVLSDLDKRGIDIGKGGNSEVAELSWILLDSKSKEYCESKENFLELISIGNIQAVSEALNRSISDSGLDNKEDKNPKEDPPAQK